MPSLNGLQPEMRGAAEWLFDGGRQYDRRLRVTSVRRTFAEQAQLYARWKAGQSDIPAAPPGHSKHQFGLAFDMARPGVDPYSDELLAYLGSIWNEIGGTWHPSDPVHFEV